MLVTGASGALGPRIIEALQSAGYAVRALSRRPPAARVTALTEDVLLGDITDTATAARACRDVDIVFHLAALLHGKAGIGFDRSAYETTNVEGTRAVVNAAVDAGVQRLLLFSSVAVYGPCQGKLVDEDSPVFPDTPYGETKLKAEHIVLQASRAGGQKIGTVLRLGAVYGTEVKGNYRRLVRALAHGRFVPIGAGKNRRTLVYDRDVAQAALVAADHPAARGRVFNVTDGEVHTVEEIIGAICVGLGRRRPRFSIPAVPLLRFAALMDAVVRPAGYPAARFRNTIDKYLEDVAVSGARIQRELGFSPRYSLLAGWQEAIAELQMRDGI